MNNYIRLFDEEWITIGLDTQYKIKETEGEFVIVFQGSKSITDWKYNFKFRKKPYKNMPVPYYVHRGFLEVWKEINDFFLGLVKEIDKPITVVGHSHGGAIATLCMEDIWFKYPEKREKLKLVTYGAPRILGWRNYSKIKERWKNTENYSISIDLVSHIPFFFMGYLHTKKKIRIKNKSLLHKLRIVTNHRIWTYKELAD